MLILFNCNTIHNIVVNVTCNTIHNILYLIQVLQTPVLKQISCWHWNILEKIKLSRAGLRDYVESRDFFRIACLKFRARFYFNVLAFKGAEWRSGKRARPAIVAVKLLSEWSVIGWATKMYLELLRALDVGPGCRQSACARGHMGHNLWPILTFPAPAAV